MFTVYYQTEPREACHLTRWDGIDEIWDYSYHNIEASGGGGAVVVAATGVL